MQSSSHPPLIKGMAWNGMAGFSPSSCPRDFDGVHVAYTVPRMIRMSETTQGPSGGFHSHGAVPIAGLQWKIPIEELDDLWKTPHFDLFWETSKNGFMNHHKPFFFEFMILKKDQQRR